MRIVSYLVVGRGASHKVLDNLVRFCEMQSEEIVSHAVLVRSMVDSWVE